MSTDSIISIFKTAIVIINPIAIAVLFNKIYLAIFDYFLAVRSFKGRLFRFVSTYFEIIKTNRRGIFHFYYLV